MEVSIDATRDAQIDQSSKAGGPGGGPNTEEGKEVVRWNATRHGISSPAPVVPGLGEGGGLAGAQGRHPGEPLPGGTAGESPSRSAWRCSPGGSIA